VITLHPETTYRFTTRPAGSDCRIAAGRATIFRDDSRDPQRRSDRRAHRNARRDWMARSPDGFWRPDVRVQLITNDEAVILLHYTGLVEQTDAFKAAAEANQETSWADQYMRMIFRFDTGAEEYRWLNANLFIARGRLIGAAELEYEIYRVG
jgi:hypothetical protein